MKSVFDGWARQIRIYQSDNSGGYCAFGWLNHQLDTRAISGGEYSDCFKRIAGWIKANLDCGGSIGGANDSGALDIEGFKMVDLLTRGYVPEETVEHVEVTK